MKQKKTIIPPTHKDFEMKGEMNVWTNIKKVKLLKWTEMAKKRKKDY